MTTPSPCPLDLLPLPLDLRPVRDLVLSGRPLGMDETLRLLTHDDVLSVGALADEVARRRWGGVAHYAAPLLLPLHPCCGDCCHVCEELWGGAVGSISDRMVEILRREHPREVHLLGFASVGLEGLERTLRTIREAAPLSWVQGGTAPDLGELSRVSGLDPEDVARRLQRAGLDALQGGEEETYTVRGRVVSGSSESPTQARVLAWHAAAHAAGLTSVATFRYSHVQDPRELATRLEALRALQQRAAGFTVVAPIPVHLEGDLPWPGPGSKGPLPGYEDLRCVAVARLVLGNIAHVRVPWMALGLKMGPVALRFGGDDLGRVPLDAHVRAFAPATAFMGLGEPELLRALHSAGLRGLCVDGAFRPCPPPGPAAKGGT